MSDPGGQAIEEGLIARQALTEVEIAAVRALATLCDAEGLSVPVGYDYLSAPADGANSSLLYYSGATLAGFLALYNYGGSELELSGMVHPGWRRRGIFSRLIEAARDEAKARGVSRLLLVTDHSSQSCTAFARAVGARYSSSEYRMEWDSAAGLTDLPPNARNLRLQPATTGDRALLADLYARCFGNPEEEVQAHVEFILHDPGRHVYIAWLEEEPIGLITTLAGEDPEETAEIVGFAVLPELRGRGHGRRILSTAIGQLVAQGRDRIALEVAADNPTALSLYHSCHFRETAAYDYYELDVV